MAGKPIRREVMRYFAQHPGVDVFLQDITKDLNEDSRKIQACITNLIREVEYPVTIVVRGQVYRYVPSGDNKGSTESLFRLLGAAKDGSLVLEKDDGKLYKAVEL